MAQRYINDVNAVIRTVGDDTDELTGRQARRLQKQMTRLKPGDDVELDLPRRSYDGFDRLKRVTKSRDDAARAAGCSTRELKDEVASRADQIEGDSFFATHVRFLLVQPERR